MINNDIKDLNRTKLSEQDDLNVLLAEATEKADVRAVERLLRNGANPNYHRDGESPFWNLQYCEGGGDLTAYNNKRLEIALLYLQYGADPYLSVDGDKLLYYVSYCLYEDRNDKDELYVYRSRFFVLLLFFSGELTSLKNNPNFTLKDLLHYRFEYRHKPCIINEFGEVALELK